MVKEKNTNNTFHAASMGDAVSSYPSLSNGYLTSVDVFVCDELVSYRWFVIVVET